MSILVNRCLRRAHLVEELVEDWQLQHQESTIARDLDELVRECLELHGLAEHAWKTLHTLLFEEQIDDIDTAGQSIKVAVERSLNVLKLVAGLVQQAREKERVIEETKELGQALIGMNRLAKTVEEQWPKVDQRMIQESKAAFLRGEYQSPEDILHELANESAQANQ